VELVAIQTFKLRFEQGRLAEYVEDLAQVFADYPQNAALSSMLAFAHAAVGREDEARREFDALMQAVPTIPRWAHPVTLAYLAELAATLGDADRSAEVYPRLRPYAGQVVASGNAVHCPGSIDRHLGQLAATVGRFGDSEAHYEAAVALDASLRSPPLLARTRYWFGRMLVNRGGPGDVERAVPLLADSLATAERLGMAALAQDVRAALPRV
jgi:hypothetical protein